MTDAYQRKGRSASPGRPTLGRQAAALCGSLAFDSRRADSSASARRCSPRRRRGSSTRTRWRRSTRYDLPTAPNPPSTHEYQNFTGGGYFFLDQKDRLWVPTKTDHIFVLSEGADGSTLTLERDYDLTSVLDERDRADHLRAARLRRPDLVRLEEERQGRHARPARPGRSKVIKLDGRGDRELVRGRRGRRLHRLRQAHVPVQGQQERQAADRLAGAATRTPGSSSRARSTPARGRRRRSWTTATSRSPTTPTR